MRLCAFIISIVFISCNSEKESKPTVSEPIAYVAPVEQPESVESTQLYQEFLNNGVAVAQKYGGKTIIVSGIVYMVNKNDEGENFVALTAYPPYGFVQCYFNAASVGQIASINKGQRISIKGKYLSAVKTIIAMDNCQIQ